MMLSVNGVSEYRNRWIRLLRDNACNWDDFLKFNPIEDALSLSGGYFRTRLLRDYLVAYLFALSQVRHEDEKEIEIESEDTFSEPIEIQEDEQ
jgi:hypothetical protein